MDFQEFKTYVTARCRELGVTDYELYYQTAESTSVSAYQQQIHQFSASLEGGVCLRCIREGKMGYASTEALTPDTARQMVDRALDNAAALEAEEPVFLCDGGKTYAAPAPSGIRIPGTEALIRTALTAQDRLCHAHTAVTDASTCQAVAEKSRIAICNSRGLDLEEETTLVALVAGAVVEQAGEMANDYQIALGDLPSLDTDALVEKAAAEALAKLGGGPAPTGRYPVVFHPEAMCDLLEAFSPVFSAENARKGLSRLAGREGTAIAAPEVTLVDDPARPGSFLQRSFDAEGCPAFRKNIIENGRLNTLLYDLKNAALAGRETTGNASKSSYDAPVSIRPFTLYLAPGELSLRELLAQAQTGVYITSLGGIHAGANAVTGDFSLQSAGFLIEGGEKTSRVRSFTVAGNFYDLLQSIRAVGSDLEFPGMGTLGSPSILAHGLSIAGK